MNSIVASPFPFRALPEFEFRDADVAYISAERWAQIDWDDDFYGAPDLVVEVLSPPNTVEEMEDKEQLCLANGAREFWVVNPVLRHVKVSTPNRHIVTYISGQEIPLPLFGGAKIAVDAIFA